MAQFAAAAEAHSSSSHTSSSSSPHQAQQEGVCSQLRGWGRLDRPGAGGCRHAPCHQQAELLLLLLLLQGVQVSLSNLGSLLED